MKGGKLSRWQQREQGGDERAGPGFLAVRETWRFLTCWKIYVLTCPLPPRSLLGRGWRVQRPRANKPHKTPKWSFLFGSTLGKHPRAACPAASRLVLFLEVTRARPRSDPRSSSWPAGEEGRRRLPAPSPDSGPSAGRREYKGARRRQGRGREERKTPPTLAAAPREALERARAKHKQTHARSGSDRGSAAPALAAARFKGAARAPPPAPSPPLPSPVLPSPPLPLLPRPAT